MLPIGIRIKEETYQKLVKAARRRKLSRGAIAREAIELFLVKADQKEAGKAA
jgi:predicted transcriptional regulator